jgi:hypothetical protein
VRDDRCSSRAPQPISGVFERPLPPAISATPAHGTEFRVFDTHKLSSGHGERCIRVLIEEGKGFAPTAFSETEVERVVGIGEERSALVLRSGVKIPVALSFEQLEQKIYERNFRTDSAVLDLRDVTGCVASNPSSGACGASEAPANTNQCVASNQSSRASIGDKMPDGTVYAGISPETGKAM